MMRTFLIVAGLLVTGLGSRVSAQGTPTAPVQAPAFTKVGVVNMGNVFSQYDRVKIFKIEMDKAAEPFKKEKAELDKLMQQWKTALSNPDPKALTAEQRETGRRVLIDCNRRLEDLELKFKTVIGKQIEENMILLNKEINGRIREYAGANGYHLVLAFGEPEVPLAPLMQFQRLMKVIDQGGLTVAYYAPGMDISAEIVRSLNYSYRNGAVGQGGGVPPNAK